MDYSQFSSQNPREMTLGQQLLWGDKEDGQRAGVRSLEPVTGRQEQG